MRFSNVLFAAGLTFAALPFIPANAQYKYVTPEGRTVYSDQPPPKEARTVEQRDYSNAGSRVDTANLPYEVRRAAENFPVTLYTTTNCAPCDAGRTALRTRGVPFVERTITTGDDTAALKALGLQNSLPALTVGSTKINEWNEQTWQAALTVAGYPTSARLPSSYTNPSASPLAPSTATTPAAAPSTPRETGRGAPSAPASPPSSTRPDFRF